MPGDAAARLWLRAFQRLAARAAHEIKNPFNGAALNVEVVRARAGRAGEAAALAPFADAASAELARATALAEALLALARPVPVPVDLHEVLSPLVVLARAIAEAQGGSVTYEPPAEAVASALDGDAVRGGIAASLDVAVEGSSHVRCAIEPRGGDVAVWVRRSPGAVVLPGALRESIRGAGVRIEEHPDGVALLFGRAAAD